ncbi:MAG TPA: HAMP domain-containing sensor histidine kinase [Candidatus Kapabacteria bacterium]|nr:HAMP domain-containing sensor histidine kinase [Candidatus Kapabacteria bacterium]
MIERIKRFFSIPNRRARALASIAPAAETSAAGATAAAAMIPNAAVAEISPESLEQRLAIALDAKEAAEELSRVKSVILSNFTHELRTPLHSVLGFSALLADSLPEGEHRDYAQSVHASGKRLLATLSSLMELSSMETRPNDLALYPAVLAEMLVALAEHYRPMIEQRGLSLVLDVPRGTALTGSQIVLLDEDRFSRAFERIMANSIKFTHQGWIRIELTEELRERPHGWPLEERAVIKVSDSGIGMPAESAAKAFDKFKQESAGQPRAGSYDGIGIGLTLARGYLRQMNAEIGLTSEQGKGTEVSINFPAVARVEANADAAAPSPVLITAEANRPM